MDVVWMYKHLEMEKCKCVLRGLECVCVCLEMMSFGVRIQEQTLKA